MTALLHASGHWQLAVTPSNDGEQPEYRGHVNFEQGSRVPEIKIKQVVKIIMNKAITGIPHFLG